MRTAGAKATVSCLLADSFLPLEVQPTGFTPKNPLGIRNVPCTRERATGLWSTAGRPAKAPFREDQDRDYSFHLHTDFRGRESLLIGASEGAQVSSRTVSHLLRDSHRNNGGRRRRGQLRRRSHRSVVHIRIAQPGTIRTTGSRHAALILARRSPRVHITQPRARVVKGQRKGCCSATLRATSFPARQPRHRAITSNHL